MKTILIVDDEIDIVDLLQFSLQKEGYSIFTAQDGSTALEQARTKKPDLILLDWMIPEPNGIDVCRKIKADSVLASTPIIMISAKGDEFDKVFALEIGADDYINKPFSIRELIARVKAILRRSFPAASDQTTSKRDIILRGELSINLGCYEASIGSMMVPLTKTEFELLATLAKQPERVFTRKQLLDSVWGYDFFGDNRVVDVHIKRLRSKLDQVSNFEHILTIRGVGYRFSLK